MSYLEALEAFESARSSTTNMAEQIRSLRQMNRSSKLSGLSDEMAELKAEAELPTEGDIKTTQNVQALTQVTGGISGILNTVHSYKMLANKMKSLKGDEAGKTGDNEVKPDEVSKASDTTEGTDLPEGASVEMKTFKTEETPLEGEPSEYIGMGSKEVAGDVARPLSVNERYNQALREQGEEPMDMTVEPMEVTAEDAAKTLGKTGAEEAGEEAGEIGAEAGIEGTIEAGALEAGVAGAGETLGASLLVGGVVAGLTALGGELFETFRKHHHHDTSQAQAQLTAQEEAIKRAPTQVGATVSGVGFGMSSTQVAQRASEELV